MLISEAALSCIDHTHWSGGREKSGQMKASALSAPNKALALLFLQGFFYNESQWILNIT
jgi:hypothetical protein